MSREEKGGSTASQKRAAGAAVGLVRVRMRVATIVWVLDSSRFQNRSRMGEGG